MSSSRWANRCAIMTSCVILLVLAAAPSRNGYAADEALYVGADKCKSCHTGTAKGDAYGKWLTTKHSKAFATLAGDDAKKLGATKNVAEPQKSTDCLKCHETAFDVAAAQKNKKFDPTLGVQCESCHGPGSKHVDARLKAEDAEDEGGVPKLVQVGKDEIIAEPKADTCRKCHNKDGPNYKPFAYNKFFKVIAHLDPRKKRPANYLDTIPDDPTDDKDAVTPGETK